MGAFSVATGVTLLYDEGILPPNPERQAVAFASPAEVAKLGSEGLALRKTAADLAMQDESPAGTVELSSAAIQFLVQSLAASEPAPKKVLTESTSPQSGYSHSGLPPSGPDSSDSGSTSVETRSSEAAPAVIPMAAPVITSSPINLLA